MNALVISQLANLVSIRNHLNLLLNNRLVVDKTRVQPVNTLITKLDLCILNTSFEVLNTSTGLDLSELTSVSSPKVMPEVQITTPVVLPEPVPSKDSESVSGKNKTTRKSSFKRVKD